jgi:DinB superfamily
MQRVLHLEGGGMGSPGSREERASFRPLSSDRRALAPELDALRVQFEQLSADVDALVDSLRDEQFHWRPAPGVWSIAECLDHLNVTARMYLPKFDEGIAEAVRLGAYRDGPFRYSWVGRIFLRTSEPPARLRMKAPGMFLPRPGRPRPEVMATHREHQVQLIDRLNGANGLDLSRARVASPVSKWLGFSLCAGFALIAAHERRHLWQARKLAEMRGFPR